MRLLPAHLEPAELHAGCGKIEVEVVAGESAATSVLTSSPFKILVPRPRGVSIWAYTSSFGGGLVAGDQTEINVRIGAGARCYVGTQASTKIYRNPNQLPCSHVTRATLESGSVLVFTPDPVQAFAGSTYHQRQEFHLAKGAGLVLLDWFSSGRAARGERWTFERFSSRNDVFTEQKRVFVDSLRLDAAAGAIASPHRTGRFDCFAMLLLIGEPLKQSAAGLLQNISERTIERRADLICSASPVADGVVLRLAGGVEAVGRQCKHHLNFITTLLGDDPWARKW